ncbi:unnamed protein product [Phaeothamnion confervicola]
MDASTRASPIAALQDEIVPPQVAQLGVVLMRRGEYNPGDMPRLVYADGRGGWATCPSPAVARAWCSDQALFDTFLPRERKVAEFTARLETAAAAEAHYGRIIADRAAAAAEAASAARFGGAGLSGVGGGSSRSSPPPGRGSGDESWNGFGVDEGDDSSDIESGTGVRNRGRQLMSRRPRGRYVLWKRDHLKARAVKWGVGHGLSTAKKRRFVCALNSYEKRRFAKLQAEGKPRPDGSSDDDDAFDGDWSSLPVDDTNLSGAHQARPLLPAAAKGASRRCISGGSFASGQSQAFRAMNVLFHDDNWEALLETDHRVPRGSLDAKEVRGQSPFWVGRAKECSDEAFDAGGVLDSFVHHCEDDQIHYNVDISAGVFSIEFSGIDLYSLYKKIRGDFDTAWAKFAVSGSHNNFWSFCNGNVASLYLWHWRKVRGDTFSKFIAVELPPGQSVHAGGDSDDDVYSNLKPLGSLDQWYNDADNGSHVTDASSGHDESNSSGIRAAGASTGSTASSATRLDKGKGLIGGRHGGGSNSGKGSGRRRRAGSDGGESAAAVVASGFQALAAAYERSHQPPPQTAAVPGKAVPAAKMAEEERLMANLEKYRRHIYEGNKRITELQDKAAKGTALDSGDQMELATAKRTKISLLRRVDKLQLALDALSDEEA